MEVSTVIKLINKSKFTKEYIFPESVLSIELGVLLEAFVEVFDYNYTEFVPLGNRETLNTSLPYKTKVVVADKGTVKSMIKKWKRKFS